MQESELIEAFDARARRREERRGFFRTALGAGVAAAGGIAALGWSEAAMAQAAPSDSDILNFALNLEYLEAQFYNIAVNGFVSGSTNSGLPATLLTGTQTQGAVTGARKANLTDPAVIQYAREISADEAAHVAALRAALGSGAVAQPAIDLSPAVFTAAATAANIDLTLTNGVFDPYANDDSFLIAAYIFEDVGVTAYKGGAPLIASTAVLDAAAGILAAEAFHAGLIRSTLYRRGVATPALRTNADKISAARDLLDGTTASSGPPVRVASDDQGISTVQTSLTTNSGTTTAAAANIVPTDANGLAFSRTVGQVHNIAYLTSKQATSGGFFPAGTNNPNAALRQSAAN